MFSILLVVLILAIPQKTLAYDCDCTRLVHYCDTPNQNITELKETSYPATTCSFRCADKCMEEIRKELSNSTNYDSDKANNKVCDEVTPNASENRRRICVTSVSSLGGCSNSRKRQIIECILCKIFLFFNFSILL